MTLARSITSAACALALSALASCGGDARCIEGTSQSCACTDGRMGAQVCNASGTYGACVCSEAPLDASLPDAFVESTTDASIDTGRVALDTSSPPADAPGRCTAGTACVCSDGTGGFCETSGVCDCDPGPVPCAEDVDWLFEIDTSNSMVEEQVALATELPRIVRILATGDANGDGAADFAPVRSLHLGVVTPDLGADTSGIPTCIMGMGDDGILRRTSPSCPTTYPSGVFEFTPGGATSADDFAATFTCVARAGTGGCGFEQQLEASLRALSPSTPTTWTRTGFVPPTFRDGSAGQALSANAGFVRADSVLALTIVSDEDDCSVPDTSLFTIEDPRYAGVPLNLRCSTFDTALHPRSRYVDGLLALRVHPGLFVYSAITGVPTGTFADYDAMLADPAMTPRPNAEGNALQAVCSSVNGNAYPGRRMVEVARDLDAAGVQTSVSSICASSFETAVSDVVRALIAARGSC